MKSEFATSLSGEWLDDGTFVLSKPLSYYSELVCELIIVPAGFVTDFASVPRLPIVYMAFGDRAHHESVIHDYLYQTHKYSKAIADKVFLEAMKVRGKPFWIRESMYLGVFFGGASSYASGPRRYTCLQIKKNC